MEVLFVALIVFVGAVVFYLYGEVQSVDKTLWQNNTDMKQKIRHLEGEVIELNRYIKELRDKIENQDDESE